MRVNLKILDRKRSPAQRKQHFTNIIYITWNLNITGGEETVEKRNGSRPGTSQPPKEEQRPIAEDMKLTIVLHSQKMKELKDLLLAEKLNTHAISLHLTAQSQVQVGKKSRTDADGNNVRPKRTRRE